VYTVIGPQPVKLVLPDMPQVRWRHGDKQLSPLDPQGTVLKPSKDGRVVITATLQQP